MIRFLGKWFLWLENLDETIKEAELSLKGQVSLKRRQATKM